MKKIITLILVLLVAVGGEARTMRELFTEESGQLFMLIPKTLRLDMLDYYDSGQKVAAKNSLGTGTQLLEADDSYVSLRTSASKTVQMLLVTNNKDSVIAVIETFETPVSDSHISFYDTKWRLLVPKYFDMPTLESFVVKGVSKKQRATMFEDILFPLIKLSFDGPDHTTIVATHGLKEFLVPKEYKKYEKSMVQSLTYTLKGKFWKLNKDK